MKTGTRELSRGVVPTSDKYLKDRPHYAHAITAMAAMTRAGLDVQVYLGNRKFYTYPTSSSRIYTSAAQRDDEAVSLRPDTFAPGVAVESGVHYNVQGVPHKPAVVVPFTMCLEYADPHSIVHNNKAICLQGA